MANLLWNGFRAERDQYVVVAVAEDVYVPSFDSAAINVSVEHSQGFALELTTPYQPKRFLRRAKLKFADGVVAPGILRVWPERRGD
ncbi:hypothetical protein [Kribbella deserti]|uniref:Uncharacterized protein n=1 Tax=Kribbella deserti TaxID=1926257 RepID=A0ABV6QLM8_9ACTN